MLRDYNIVRFQVEQLDRRQYFQTKVSLHVEFFISDIDIMLERSIDPINSVLRSYHLKIEDFLIDNLVGLS